MSPAERESAADGFRAGNLSHASVPRIIAAESRKLAALRQSGFCGIHVRDHDEVPTACADCLHRIPLRRGDGIIIGTQFIV